MLERFFNYLSTLPKWISIFFVILVLVLCLFSCQGLFNVNAADSSVDVALVDSLNLEGGD